MSRKDKKRTQQRNREKNQQNVAASRAAFQARGRACDIQNIQTLIDDSSKKEA